MTLPARLLSAHDSSAEEHARSAETNFDLFRRTVIVFDVHDSGPVARLLWLHSQGYILRLLSRSWFFNLSHNFYTHYNTLATTLQVKIRASYSTLLG
jgi:hypothetical protein